MRCMVIVIATALLIAVAMPASSQLDLKSDSWTGTDALGRKLPDYNECGGPRPGKYVGLFYFLWLGQHGVGGPYDITKILAANPTNPAWGPLWAFHHWGEPELGYYLSDDDYVIRKHCQMMVNAGIDVIIFDVTNGYTYDSNWNKLLSIYQQIRSQGGTTPQICFFANTSSSTVVQHLYNVLYSQGLYSDLWFYWNGKPLILAPKTGLSQTLLNFFTFRKTWGLSTPDEVDEWSFMQLYPQGYGWHTPGVPEQITVSVAQQETYMTAPTAHGRSYHNGQEPPVGQRDNYGRNFQEQWDRALAIDPDFIFITGWNEWVAQRFVDQYNNTFFVDQYTQEFSRDIEPMKDGHTDNYYYQMVSNIRRFKGVRTPDAASPPKTIKIDGNFTDWDDVAPEYRDASGDTRTRNYPGWGSAGRYTNYTGRNDIVKSKVAYDSSNTYFYVETKDSLLSHTGSNWMMLFIDSDCNSSTGWNGYDYLVNSQVINDTTTTLKRCIGGWNWAFVSNISYRYSGNKMEICIPRTGLGLTGNAVTFDFHWADNIQKTDDIIEFAVSGDSAPDRRFNYRYNSTSATPIPSPCYYEPFSYSNGALNGNGGWSGTAGSQIEVTDGTLKLWGGASSYYCLRDIACAGQNGVIRVQMKVKSGMGSGNIWNLWIDDSQGRNLARWYGSGTTARGRIGAGTQVTNTQTLTGGWDDLYVIIYTTTNQSQFFFNGNLIGTLSHAETGAGDSVAKVKFEQINNSGVSGNHICFDDLIVGKPDNGSAAAIKKLPDDSPVSLGDKILYLAGSGFGYIEEPDRTCGVKVAGTVPAENQMVSLVGAMKTTSGGERYIQITAITANGPASVSPVGACNSSASTGLMDGLLVKTWGTVKPGSVTSNSYVITDGSDNTGIKVISPWVPTVKAGDFVVVTGAAGYDNGRVIYQKSVSKH